MSGTLSSDRVHLAPDEDSHLDASYDRIEHEDISPADQVGPTPPNLRVLYDANAEALLDGLASESEPESEMSYYPASSASFSDPALDDLDPLARSSGFEELDRLEQGLEKLQRRHLILERIHMAHMKGVNAFVESQRTSFHILNIILLVFFSMTTLLAILYLQYRGVLLERYAIPIPNDLLVAFYKGAPPVGFVLGMHALMDRAARYGNKLNVKQRRYYVRFVTAINGCLIAMLWSKAAQSSFLRH